MATLMTLLEIVAITVIVCCFGFIGAEFRPDISKSACFVKPVVSLEK